LFYTTSWERAELPPSPTRGVPGHWLIFADSGGVGQALAGQLDAAGGQCHLVCDDAPETVIAAACDVDHQRFRGVVYLCGLDDPSTDDVTLQTLAQSQQRGVCGAVALIQALARRGWTEPPSVWLVTRNCYPADGSGLTTAAAQSPLWGLGQVVGYEHPELRCRLLDLSQLTVAGEAQALAHELLADDREDTIAWRADARHVARLVPYRLDAPVAATRIPESDEAFRLESAAPGDLQHLALRAAPRTSPGPGEIEIAVHAAGVNFLDVLIALDDYPDDLPEGAHQLGRECAGIVTAIGEGVTDFSPGQAVVALAPWSFGSHVTTPACLAVPRPPTLTAEDAATLPMAFLTACYALERVGRLAKGERVLIHAATGGVGLAAIQVAQCIGAEIFATAGSAEKRELLRSLGIEHVMDSRTLAFADEVMARTGGQGVDLVLNCLVGDAIPAGLSILRAGGRFCDISKRDIRRDAPLPLGLFRKGISYSAINLSTLIAEQPDVMGALLRDVIARVGTGVLQPLRHEMFPISRATDAFQRMARAGHIGKIVLRLQDRDARIETSAPFVSPDATYLMTGGLGALGLATAAWLVERGARHLTLIGRRRPSPAAERMLADLRHAGADVAVLQADVTDRAEMVRVIETIDARWPLRGVVHTAGTLDDGVLMQLTPERVLSPMGPKVDGAWNLHELTAERPLDFFVLFSSAVSLIGAPGQANYAAANAFLDALARYRRSRGLPAVSVQWGPWTDVGMAALHTDRGERLAAQGMGGLTTRDALSALGALLAAGSACPPHVGVLRFDATRWCEAHALSSPRFTRLRDRTQANAESTTSAVRARLAAEANGSVRREMLELYLREQAARVLRLEPTQIEIRGALQRLGLDSLMTLELRRRIETGLGLRLPVTVMWDYPTIAALAPFLLDRLGLSLQPPTADPGSSAPSAPDAEQLVSLLEALGKISSDDLARLAHNGAGESKSA
jgi:NADPH:quinone reductase-like Zn-dependent oxidoreductase/acyl carrier protein